jgi:hypothetical protein
MPGCGMHATADQVGETNLELLVESGQAALRVCREMLRKNEAQLFRGQSHDWPRLIPGLFRSTGAERARASDELEMFRSWAVNVPQMGIYWNEATAITAIAQHYGIATNLLDLTDDPEVALLFSKSASADGTSVIYCFEEEALKRLTGARLVRIDVHNLWRLEAQRGLFLEFLDEGLGETLRASAVRIRFPNEVLSATERSRLYPARKSALEVVIDQWFYRRELERLTNSFEATRLHGVRRHTYPGAFRWRQMPVLDADWMHSEPGWVFPQVESVEILSDPVIMCIPLPDFSSPERALMEVIDCVRSALQQSDLRKQLVSFAVELPLEKKHFTGSVETLINRCWDGVRQLPYSQDDRTYSLALTIVLLLARTIEIDSVDKWPEKLFGELEILEVAPIGGHIEAAVVSKAMLIESFSSEHHHRLTSYMRRKAAEDPLFLMNYIVDHWMLFNLERFQRLFVRQFVPTAIDGYWREDLNLHEGALGCLWSITFNPALLGYVTSSNYRFQSPLGLEKDCGNLIYILPDMDQSDVREVFISCMPWILGGGKPYQVLFHGYGMDSRPVWKIARAVRHAKWICEVGGTSPLDVFPSLQNFVSPKDDPDQFLRSQGLGAFEIWLMAKNKLEKMNHKPIDNNHPFLKRFWKDLMSANAKIDAIAKGTADWPGAIASTE